MSREGEGPLLNRERLAGVLGKLLFAWIYCLGITRLILRLNNLPTDLLSQGLAMFLLLLLLTGLTWQRFSLLALSGLLLAATGLAYYYREEWLDTAIRFTGNLRGSLDWAVGWFGGQNTGTDEQLTNLAMFICLAVAVASYLTLARFNLPFLSLLVLVLISSLGYSLPRRELYLWILLAGVAVIAAFSRKQNRTYNHLGWRRHHVQTRFMLQSLPVAAVTLSLAILFSNWLPPLFFRSSGLERLVEDISGLIIAGQNGQTAIPDFSIASAGFYPLVDRLGGPVILSDQPVMQIAGYPRPMLLRGAISRTYDGQHWLGDPGGQILSFDNQIWQQERDQVFDLNRPDLSQYREALLDQESASLANNVQYRLTPVNLAFQTVFLAGRPLAMAMTGDYPYQIFFDAAGQLFNRDWLLPEQTLLVDTRLLQTGQPAFAEAAAFFRANLSRDELEYFEYVRSRYLQLPDLPQYQPAGDLTRLVVDLAGQATEPYEQAHLLKEYLQKTCQYNLQVAVPPADSDFVTWFLQTREGYCVYFASALTMMCRLAGIPARYIEGYYAPGTTNPDGSRLITGEYAHAWTEIFLAGVGWIAIDATPGGAVIDPEVTPVPTGTATPTPVNNPLTPTPLISLSPTAAPTGQPDNPLNWDFQWPSPWWLLLLLLLPLLFIIRAIRWLRHRHRAAWLRDFYNDDRRLAIFYWSELLDILAQLGIRRQTGETPAQLIARVECQSTWLAGRRPAAATLLHGVEKALYSQDSPTENELACMSLLYDMMEKTLEQNRSRLLFLWHRICYHKLKRGMNH